MEASQITDVDSMPVVPFAVAIGALVVLAWTLEVTVFGKLTAPSVIGFVLRTLIAGVVVGAVGGYALAFCYSAVRDVASG